MFSTEMVETFSTDWDIMTNFFYGLILLHNINFDQKSFGITTYLLRQLDAE